MHFYFYKFDKEVHYWSDRITKGICQMNERYDSILVSLSVMLVEVLSYEVSIIRCEKLNVRN